MTKTMHICEGTCHGEVDDETFKKGLNVCGTEGCDKHHQPFTKVLVCENCEAKYKPDEEHVCEKSE